MPGVDRLSTRIGSAWRIRIFTADTEWIVDWNEFFGRVELTGKVPIALSLRRYSLGKGLTLAEAETFVPCEPESLRSNVSAGIHAILILCKWGPSETRLITKEGISIA